MSKCTWPTSCSSRRVASRRSIRVCRARSSLPTRQIFPSRPRLTAACATSSVCARPGRNGSLKTGPKNRDNLCPMIKIKSFDGGEFDGYLSMPASGYGPGIVVLQEIFGINSFMREVAGWYAAHGFVALVPDLFWRIERNVELTDKGDDWNKAVELYQKIDEAKAVEDSAATVAFLRKHPACSGRVGAVGFCFGGNLAYLLSVRFKPDCAAGYYGVSLEKTLDEAKNLNSPLLLHLAGLDKFCPPEAQAQIHAALDPNPLVTVHDYTHLDHGFARLGGEHYDAAAAELANLRTLEFFVSQLAGAGCASAQQTLSQRWDDHVKYEFATRNT